MDSDDDYLYDDDSGNESPEDEEEDEVDDFGIDMDPEPGGSHAQKIEDEYPFEVLSTEKIVSNMVESIKEGSMVVQDQIPTTTVRILLNHFKWDKERLMERLYSDDQEAMFVEAQVISPFKKKPEQVKKKTLKPTEDCEICCLSLPKAMMRGLECGHLYCTSCWTEYLPSKIM